MEVPLKTWIESSKPHMSAIWLSSGLIPGAVAWVDGVFDFATCTLEVILCWLMLTLACYADEYGDLASGVDNEARLGPITPMQRGEIGSAAMRRALAVVGLEAASVGAALVTYSWWRNPTSLLVPACFLAAGAICIAAAFLYTMGDHPYGYAGLGDFAGFFFFGVVAVCGGFWLYAHEMDWSVFLPGAACGLMLAASINLNNIRDMDNDAVHGKMTLAVKLGRKRAQTYHYILLGAACVLYLLFPIVYGMTHVVHYLFVCSYILVAKHAADFCRAMLRGSLVALKPLMKPLMNAMLAQSLAFCACVVAPL